MQFFVKLRDAAPNELFHKVELQCDTPAFRAALWKALEHTMDIPPGAFTAQVELRICLDIGTKLNGTEEVDLTEQA